MAGLEKAILEFQKTNNRIDVLSSKIEELTLEFFGSPTTTFPKFDGSAALAWLARANLYFLVNKTPLDTRVAIAISAISGPAMPWLHLLLKRCLSLSWDKFTRELLCRFGNSKACSLEIKAPFATSESHDGDTSKEPWADSENDGAATSASFRRLTVPPTSTLHDKVEIVSVAKEKESWDRSMAKNIEAASEKKEEGMSTAKNIEAAGEKKEEANALFKAGRYARVSKIYEQVETFIKGEGTGGNYKNCLTKTHIYYRPVCSIIVGFHATGNRLTRYWFSGRGMRWKKRPGWMLQACEGSFIFYIRLEGKAVSRVRQLIRVRMRWLQLIRIRMLNREEITAVD